MEDRTNILMPIAGRAQRFLDKGFTLPKPLIDVAGVPMIQRALKSVEVDNPHYIFIVREEHINDHNIDERLTSLLGDDIEIVVADRVTEGAACSCLLAEEHIDSDNPLIIFTPDCFFEPPFNPDSISERYDGAVGVFHSTSDAHSYVETDARGDVTRAAEKQVISEDAVGGLYYYKRGSDFVKYSKQMIEQELKVNGEYYICPVFNLLIANGMKVGIEKQQKHVVLGTPHDLETYVRGL
jgi:dTDP-glucose pyrophosphorylase